MKKVVILMGLSGTGKSFVANLIAKHFGFYWIRSDLIRKEITLKDTSEKLSVGYMKGIYTPEVTKLVYHLMMELGRDCLKKGKGIVIDATFIEDWQRELALKYFPHAIYINTVASEDVIKKRLMSRKDISDADYHIYLRQKEKWKDPHYAIKLSTDRPSTMILQDLKSLIK